MHINILTIFPGMFQGFLQETLIKKAADAGLLSVNPVDIRAFATNTHHTTDDTPYGGGPGMLMKVEPIYNALEALKLKGRRQEAIGNSGKRDVAPTAHSLLPVASRTVLLSPRGRQFNQSIVEEYAKLDSLTLICGRYEGVDQRVADHLCDEELSIGPYVLSGGEVAAMVVMEAVSRYIPGVLGNPDSLKEESHVETGNRQKAIGNGSRRDGVPTADSLLPTASSVEYPQYTKPAEFHGWAVPEVLLSGNHEAIAQWRATHTTPT